MINYKLRVKFTSSKYYTESPWKYDYDKIKAVYDRHITEGKTSHVIIQAIDDVNRKPHNLQEFVTFNGGSTQIFDDGNDYLISFDSFSDAHKNYLAKSDTMGFFVRTSDDTWHLTNSPITHFKHGSFIADKNLAMIMGEIPVTA